MSTRHTGCFCPHWSRHQSPCHQLWQPRQLCPHGHGIIRPQILALDRFFSRALFIFLLATCRNWYFVAETIATYGLSRMMMSSQQSSVNKTLAHLLFRYVGFWWVHTALVGTPSRKLFSALSGAYWASVGLLISVES